MEAADGKLSPESCCLLGTRQPRRKLLTREALQAQGGGKPATPVVKARHLLAAPAAQRSHGVKG